MEITVSETLRLKNEISQIVNNFNRSIRHSSLGHTTENGEKTSEGNETSFKETISNLQTALKYSEDINNAIARFNSENRVDSKVRTLQNSKMLIEIYKNALPKTKSTKTVRFDTVGNNKQKVEVQYIPDVTSTEIKNNIKQEKLNIRKLQSEIEVLNQKKIHLSFDYSDVESLITE